MDPDMDDPMSDEEDLPAEMPQDGGDQGVVIEGAEIPEEDVYAYGDPDDPLDRVLDVYLADELEDHLYLLQYPMRPADRPSSTPSAAKVKVANHLLEVQHAIKQGGKHFDNNAPQQLRQATQTHTGSRVRPATNFAFGVIRSNELHLTPVHATMQMRPSFQHIDDAKALEIEMDLDDPDNGGAKGEEVPQQVSFKKKESERATAARKSTYAYKKSIEDKEQWVQLEVHGQNDDQSLSEFSKMFVDYDADDALKGTKAKEFPPPERYLQGLDYMEEYDENGESFSAGSRGRSLDDSIDLATAGLGSYSAVKIPTTPLHQLGGDAKVVGYLKLAHLVPFSVLLDVTKMSSMAVMMALSAEGRRRGLLLRGNWAARPTDVWPKGPPHAADCLSVAHLLLHRFGAVSRPDLQRRFPDLAPATLKEVLSNIAQLDTIGRRWVPKLKDGIDFGLQHPDIVELEEERWAVHASSLEERLGKDILAPPTCEIFRSYPGILESAGVGGAFAPQPPSTYSTASTAAMGREDATATARFDDTDQILSAKFLQPKAEGSMAKATGGGAAAVAEAGTGAVKPKRHFKPKKRPTKAVSAAAEAVGGGTGEAAIKQEHEGVGRDAADGDGGEGGNMPLLSAVDTMVTDVQEQERLGGDEGEEVGIEEVPVVEEGVVRVSARTAAAGVGRPRRNIAPPAREDGEEGIHDDDRAWREDGSAARGASGVVRGKGKAPSGLAGLAAAKEEPREKSASLDGAEAGMDVGIEEIGGPGRAAGGEAEEAVVAGIKKTGVIAKGKAKEEPAPRPKVRPRATRTKKG